VCKIEGLFGGGKQWKSERRGQSGIANMYLIVKYEYVTMKPTKIILKWGEEVKKE
jgi:hypothetical protein